MKKKYQARFPMARIKKLMQKDDEVGKIAVSTPIVMSKAVELFMQSLIEATVGEARSASSRKMLPLHLKSAVLNCEKFDFLKEIVQNVSLHVDEVVNNDKQPKKKAKTPEKSNPNHVKNKEME